MRISHPPGVTRYSMVVHKAVELVIQVACRKVAIQGESVKILDLARSMI